MAEVVTELCRGRNLRREAMQTVHDPGGHGRKPGLCEKPRGAAIPGTYLPRHVPLAGQVLDGYRAHDRLDLGEHRSFIRRLDDRDVALGDDHVETVRRAR